MTDQDIKNAPQYAWNNRASMQESATCGCYQCLQIMSVDDIEEWTDYGKTALCPKCGCDCIIPQSVAIPMDEASMRKLREYWIGK